MRSEQTKMSVSDITTAQLKKELEYEKNKKNYIKTVFSTVGILLVVAAIAILISSLFMPVLRVVGSSMKPALYDNQIIVTLKTTDFSRGDIIAFYYNNKILLKRVIAVQGDKVTVNDKGDVYVNGELLDEPYVTSKGLGECDIAFPYQVPDSKVFVMGDNRETSVDSRSTKIGCVSDEMIVGKVIFRVWPLNEIGTV